MRRLSPAVVLVLPLLVAPRGPELPTIALNDNRAPAGASRNGVLELVLEVTRGRWYVLGDDEAPAEMLAFGEAGQAPQIPGPLIRVLRGTTMHVTVRNLLDTTLVVHGLSSRRTTRMDSLIVPAGAVRDVTFAADAEGTYFYWATTTGAALEDRVLEDSQLGGAIVVDPPQAAPGRDRIFVIGLWMDGKLPNGEPDDSREFLTINGRPWPLTERLTYDLGDSVRWRLVNVSAAPHPMHLHGFFYRIDSRGDMARDTIYEPHQRRMAVTELMGPGTTMAMVWSPDRPGGWIFHCHLSWHVIPNPTLGPNRETDEQREDRVLRGDPSHDPHHHVVRGMGGLMLAMYVRPPDGWRLHEARRRQLRLFVQSDSAPGDSTRRFGYVLQDGDREPAPDSVRWPGSTLVLWRGAPTSVWVINRTPEPTQVHWHGLEIESYYDGVAGVGGYATMLTPAILPNDSFDMRITPPRAGSFMYHTHVNDIRQQSRGLYGAFIVLPPDASWDPETDRTFMVASTPDDAGFILNGTEPPPPLTFRVGVTYRLRLMNITLGGPDLRLRLVRNGGLERWTPLAKDGWDYPPERRVAARSEQLVSIGETYDFSFRPTVQGELALEVRRGDGELVTREVIRVVRRP
jgi:manganese oxidase